MTIVFISEYVILQCFTILRAPGEDDVAISAGKPSGTTLRPDSGWALMILTAWQNSSWVIQASISTGTGPILS